MKTNHEGKYGCCKIVVFFFFLVCVIPFFSVASNNDSHVLYYPLPIGPGFIVPQTHNLFGGQFAYGTTLSTSAKWKQYDAYTIYMDVDTSAACFTSTPVYITSLGKRPLAPTMSGIIGVNSLYDPNRYGFRVYLRVQNSKDGENYPLYAELENSRDLHVNWVGAFPYISSEGEGFAFIKDTWLSTNYPEQRLGIPEDIILFSSLNAGQEPKYAHLTNGMAQHIVDTQFEPRVHIINVRYASHVCDAHPPGYLTTSDVIDWGWTMSYLPLKRGYSYDPKSTVLAVVGSVKRNWEPDQDQWEKCIDIDVSDAGFIDTPIYIFSRNGDDTYYIGYTYGRSPTSTSNTVCITTEAWDTIYNPGGEINYLAIGKVNQEPPACYDECTDKYCYNYESIVLCYNNDGDPCWETNVVPCPVGMHCGWYDSEYACRCDYECNYGDRECLSTSRYRYCDWNGYCLKWVESACPSGHHCENGTCVDSSCTPGSNKTISGFTPVMQPADSNWCWAATIEMIADYYGVDLEQCQIVNNLFDYSEPGGCCTYPYYCLLYWADSPQDVSGLWEDYGFKKDETNIGLLWDSIKKVIACSSSPIQVFINYSSYGHVEVIIGYYEYSDPDTGNQIYACDPLDGKCYWIAESAYRTGNGRSWYYSIFNFSK